MSTIYKFLAFINIYLDVNVLTFIRNLGQFATQKCSKLAQGFFGLIPNVNGPYPTHVIFIVNVVDNYCLITNYSLNFIFSSPPLFTHSFCVKKKLSIALKLYRLKFNLNAHKPQHKKGFKIHVKQKKRRKVPQPTKLDFQNSNNLHDIWGTMQRDN
jgi:hypothetical protein